MDGLRGLEERADLYRRMARRAQMGNRSSIERRFHNRSESAERHAAAIRDAIAKLASSGDLAEESL